MTARRALVVATFAIVATMGLGGVTRGLAQDTVPSLNPMTAIPRDALKDFLERPLFDATRRLQQIAPRTIIAETRSVPPGPPTLHLLGVIHGLHDMAFARRKGATRTLTLRTGDRIDDWNVIILPPIGVRLQRGYQTFDYALFTAGPVAAGPFDAAPGASVPSAGLPLPANPPGQTDAIGMPDVFPDGAFKISPN